MNTILASAGRFAIAAAILFPLWTSPAAAQVVNRGTEGKPLSEIRPAPRSIYPDQNVITAEPAPSDVNDAYLGPVLLMKSARVDVEAGTVTLPLHRGRLVSGEAVWSILTDTTDENLSKLHGVPYSPKLAYGLTGKATRQAHVEKDGTIVFASGRVDFSPKWNITPGSAPNFFPPRAAQPGSIGDADYSPLVRFDNGKNAVFNMPMVASNVSEQKLNTMCNGNVDHNLVHDKVVGIWPRDGTVTIGMTLGYTFGKPIFYISTEANDRTVAALETATYTPVLSDLPFALEDASPGEPPNGSTPS